MKDANELLLLVYSGGDQAVEAAKSLAGIARWTECSERLPKIVTESVSEVVLAWRPGELWPQPAFQQLEDGKRTWRWNRDEPPTHWMQMPDLPPDAK